VSTLKNGQNSLRIEIPEELLDIKSYQGCQIAILSDVIANLDILKSHEQLFLTGTVDFQAALNCADCGVEFDRFFSEPLEIEFQRATPTKAGPSVHELSDDELERAFYEGEEVDLLPPIRDTVLLAVPIAPLCKPDCKGICPECGANLNEVECSCCVTADAAE
jgi:uncharacterized protein